MSQTGSQDRRCGVEIEFSGLTAHDAARVLADTLGGRVEVTGRHTATVRDTSIGRIKVLLDTRYAAPARNPGLIDDVLDRLEMREDAAELLASVMPVPVEIVTDPITRAEFADLERAIAALRDAGSMGTKGGTLFAYGMHLNPEHLGEPERAIRIAAAYAFAERWLRHASPPDNARRVTPFVDPYPESYVLALARAYRGTPPDLEVFIALYRRHNPDRNRGLDMWPLLGHLAPEAAERHHGGPIKNARPAFHYRLPDSQVSSPDWTPLTELDRWERVERAADDPAAFESLRDAAERVASWRIARKDYYLIVQGVLA